MIISGVILKLLLGMGNVSGKFVEKMKTPVFMFNNLKKIVPFMI